MLIDVHNHFHPPEYLEALKSGDGVVTVTVAGARRAARGARQRRLCVDCARAEYAVCRACYTPLCDPLAVDFAASDRVMAASDYPHQIGSISLMRESLGALNVSEGEHAKDMGENAARLYGLTA